MTALAIPTFTCQCCKETLPERNYGSDYAGGICWGCADEFAKDMAEIAASEEARTRRQDEAARAAQQARDYEMSRCFRPQYRGVPKEV